MEKKRFEFYDNCKLRCDNLIIEVKDVLISTYESEEQLDHNAVEDFLHYLENVAKEHGIEQCEHFAIIDNNGEEYLVPNDLCNYESDDFFDEFSDVVGINW